MGCQFNIALSFATENQPLVETVYNYLKGQDFRVFFAPSQEGQAFISGKNQRQVFYRIFGLEAEYAALFVSKEYVRKKVPMEEARIALINRVGKGTVIPIYLDGTPLPDDLFDPRQTNYFRSKDPVAIAAHLAARCRECEPTPMQPVPQGFGGMYISDNHAETMVNIKDLNGGLHLWQG